MMPPRRLPPTLFPIALLSFALVGLSSHLFADSPASPAKIETARRLFAEATRDQDAGRWEQALRKLDGVATIKETAGVRFHIGNCQQQLGRLLAALESFQRAQALAQDSRTPDVLELVGPRIEELRSRIPTITVRVVPQHQDTVVRVDGQILDRTLVNTPIGYDPGQHSVVVMFPGQISVTRDVVLAEQQSSVLDLSPPAPPSPRASAHPRTRQSLPPQSSNATVPVGAWIAFGAGAGLAMGGFFAFKRAGSIADDSAQVCPRSVWCDPARVDAVRRWDTIALGLWSASIVTVGSTVAWTLLSRRPTSAALAVHPSGVSIHGAF